MQAQPEVVVTVTVQSVIPDEAVLPPTAVHHVGHSVGCLPGWGARLAQDTYQQLEKAKCNLRYLVFDGTVERWRAFPLRSEVPSRTVHWLVCGTARGGHGCPSTVFQGTQDFLRGTLEAVGPEDAHVYVTLNALAAQTDRVLPNVSFNTSLSAIGDYARSIQVGRHVHLHVTLVLPISSSVWGDIHANALNPAATLKRACKGTMSFHCTFPEKLEGFSLQEAHSWAARTVITHINTSVGGFGTLAELKSFLQVRYIA